MILEGTCTSKESYIRETRRNVEIRWEEHKDTQEDSELAKYSRNHSGHALTWIVLYSALRDDWIKKTLNFQ